MRRRSRSFWADALAEPDIGAANQRWWLSFVGFLTLMCISLLYLFIISKPDADRAQDVSVAMRQFFSVTPTGAEPAPEIESVVPGLPSPELAALVPAALDQQAGIDVHQTAGRLEINLDADVIFFSQSADITERGVRSLVLLLAPLQAEPYAVSLELGLERSVPGAVADLNTRLMHNRAASVVRFLQERGVTLSQFTIVENSPERHSDARQPESGLALLTLIIELNVDAGADLAGPEVDDNND